MIYFVQPIDGGPIKIGTTIDIGKRFGDLDRMNSTPLKLLAVTEGGIDVERSIHERFKFCNYRYEWFHPTEELLIYISEISKGNQAEPHLRCTDIVECHYYKHEDFHTEFWIFECTGGVWLRATFDGRYLNVFRSKSETIERHLQRYNYKETLFDNIPSNVSKAVLYRVKHFK